MRKQDFFGWVFVFVFGTIGGLVGTIFFAVWFIGCGDETFTSAEAPLPDSDSGNSGMERMLVNSGDAKNEAEVKDGALNDVFADSQDSSIEPSCSPDADIGDAAIAANPGFGSCFQVTRSYINDGGMAVLSVASCSAPVDCAKTQNPLSYVCYGGDGGQLAVPYGCTSITQGTANIWWGCCL